MIKLSFMIISILLLHPIIMETLPCSQIKINTIKTKVKKKRKPVLKKIPDQADIIKFCGAGKSFVWCGIAASKSPVKPQGEPNMQIMHYLTGCDDISLENSNFFRGTKSEIEYKFEFLDRVLIGHIENGGCGKIDASEFKTNNNSGNSGTPGNVTTLPSGIDTLGFGEGTIKYFAGIKDVSTGTCNIINTIGSLTVKYDKNRRIVTIKDGVGFIMNRFTSRHGKKMIDLGYYNANNKTSDKTSPKEKKNILNETQGRVQPVTKIEDNVNTVNTVNESLGRVQPVTKTGGNVTQQIPSGESGNITQTQKIPTPMV